MKNITYLLALLLSGLIYQSCDNARANSISGVEPIIADGELLWYSIEDIEKVVNKDQKMVLVDVYTTWCGWCKVMDKKTFTDPEVIDYLNENFHLVKFNAEQRESLEYMGKTYDWIQAGRRGVNQLAVELLNGRLGYPTIVYLDQKLNKIRVSPGYKDPGKLMSELKSLNS